MQDLPDAGALADLALHHALHQALQLLAWPSPLQLLHAPLHWPAQYAPAQPR